MRPTSACYFSFYNTVTVFSKSAFYTFTVADINTNVPFHIQNKPLNFRKCFDCAFGFRNRIHTSCIGVPFAFVLRGVNTAKQIRLNKSYTIATIIISYFGLQLFYPCFAVIFWVLLFLVINKSLSYGFHQTAPHINSFPTKSLFTVFNKPLCGKFTHCITPFLH